MKKTNRAAVVIITALTLVGCARMDEQFEYRTKHISFDASFEETTRTEYTGAGKINWAEGDTIRYFSKEAGEVGNFIVEETKSYTIIEADVEDNAKYFVAEYGGTGIKSNNDSTFVITGASNYEQDGKFGSAHVSVARTTDLESSDLIFKNITSLIKFEIERNDIAYMSFTSTDDTKIQGNGDIIVSFDKDGNPVGRFNEEKAGTSIKVRIEGPGTYYLATLPVILKNGFRCDFYASDGKKLGVATGSNQLTIEKNEIVNLGLLDPHIEDGPKDLGMEGTANCYIVDAIGDYQFNASVKGNGKGSDVIIANIDKATLLWGSNLTGYSPGAEGIIKDIRYDNGYISFTSVSSGNAVIAALDASGTVLWSWHIWVSLGYDAYSKGQIYIDNLGQKVCRMMDRNLGALSADKADYILTHGLMYEWGRKDPFTTSDQYNTATGYIVPKIPASETSGTIDYATQKPTVFIYGNNASGMDWIYSNHDSTLWGSDKTIYDPCPPGWRVPDENVYTRALNNEGSYYGGLYENQQYYGVDFGGVMGNDQSIWYPGAGYFDPQYEGAHKNRSRYGFFWTNATDKNSSGLFKLYFNQMVYPKSFAYRSYGASVRCMAIKTEPDPIPAEKVTLDKHELNLRIDLTDRLSYIISPDNVTSKTVTWSSSNPTVASVDTTGVVTALAEGDCWIKAKSADGPSDSCHIIVPKPSRIDLSASESANCYIINGQGDYSFRTVKGNSDEQIVGGSVAVTLWESFGNDKMPYSGDLIKNVHYNNGTITFSVPSNMKDGNAVIALRDANGTILWSWHIWLCKGYELDKLSQTYGNGAIMMDRNLGALTSEKGNPLGIGLLYQWGRKDPFLNSSSFSANQAVRTNADGLFNVVEKTPDITGLNITYSIEHPTTYLTSENDWDGSNGGTSKWDQNKTIYDPCPAGWRVPDGGYYGVWASYWVNHNNNRDSATLHQLQLWDSSKHGFEAGEQMGCSSSVWYPATGYRYYRDGNIYGYGQYSMYWSCTPVDGESYILYNNVYMITLMNINKRPGGAAVRCQKIGSYSARPIDSITISKNKIEMNVGETDNLTATVFPANASLKIVIWESSDQDYVSVDASGKITALKETYTKYPNGEEKEICTPLISAKSIDGMVQGTCIIRVGPKK